MKQAKIPKKRIIAMLMPLFYFKTHNVNQRKALDKSARLVFNLYLLLHAIDCTRHEIYSSRAETKSDPMNNS